LNAKGAKVILMLMFLGRNGVSLSNDLVNNTQKVLALKPYKEVH